MSEFAPKSACWVLFLLGLVGLFWLIFFLCFFGLFVYLFVCCFFVVGIFSVCILNISELNFCPETCFENLRVSKTIQAYL